MSKWGGFENIADIHTHREALVQDHFLRYRMSKEFNAAGAHLVALCRRETERNINYLLTVKYMLRVNTCRTPSVRTEKFVRLAKNKNSSCWNAHFILLEN